MSVDLVRDAAIDVLLRVTERGALLDEALDRLLKKRDISDRGRRFLTQLVYGVERNRTLCDHAIRPLVDQPLDDLPMSIRIILRMGVFQSLFCSQVTFPAMVHTSVDLAKKRTHAGIAKLVNAVLRRAPKSLDDVRLPKREKNEIRHFSVRYSIPEWLVELWKTQFGSEQLDAICAAMNEQAPVTIRTNSAKITPEDLIARLAKSEITATKTSPIPEELTVPGFSPTRSKLFQQGFFILQDPASMLVSHLVQPEEGEWILDACAAPGGKTTHLATLGGPSCKVVAMDISARRSARIRENIERLELENVARVCGNAEKPPFNQGLDAILLDAPCTGLGTLRRHPDLKWRVQPEDAARLAETQRALLRNAVALCKNGGRIVYSVCTFAWDETLAIREFAATLDGLGFEDGPDWLNQWKIDEGTYRTLPHAHNMDGFFLMRLRKAY